MVEGKKEEEEEEEEEKKLEMIPHVQPRKKCSDKKSFLFNFDMDIWNNFDIKGKKWEVVKQRFFGGFFGGKMNFFVTMLHY